MRSTAASATTWDGASTITLTSGSVPLGRSSTRPPSAELGFDLADLSPDRLGLGQAVAVGDGHVAQHLGAALQCRPPPCRRGGLPAVIKSASSRPDRTPSPVVANERNTMWPDCSPPSAQPWRIEGLQDVAVADADRLHLDPGGPHRLVEAEVRHHRDHDGPAREQAPPGQVGGEQGEQPVAVDNVAAGVDGDDPVGVPVEGQAQVGSLAHQRPWPGGRGRWSRSRR